MSDLTLLDQLTAVSIAPGSTGWDAALGSTIFDAVFQNVGERYLGTGYYGNSQTSEVVIYQAPAGFFVLPTQIIVTGAGVGSASVRMAWGLSTAATSWHTGQASTTQASNGSGQACSIFRTKPRPNDTTGILAPEIMDGDDPATRQLFAKNVGSSGGSGTVYHHVMGIIWPKEVS